MPEVSLTVRSCLALFHSVITPVAVLLCPVRVSPTTKDVLSVILGEELSYLVTRSFTGNVILGAEVNPVPNLVTSTPLTEPIPDCDQGRNVAPVPCVVYVTITT